ncbi:chalcone isomerase family protein [Catenovulum sp. SX2]|uniref:chalcone isomerase family protein n=1 Tax=Catenovulum sp. SX2 TaxID=3398614 RepID=UPI003F87F8F4
MKISVFVWLTAVVSTSLSAEVPSPLRDLYKHGQGTMQVYFWKLYDAEFYLPSKTLDLTDYPQALKITYLRDIKKKDLIDATKEQWQHIGLTHENQNSWLKLLDDIWPEITKNDTLVVRVELDGTSQFFYRKAGGKSLTLLGDVADPEFGKSFLAIWLSPKTSRPDLREQLLGLADLN